MNFVKKLHSCVLLSSLLLTVVVVTSAQICSIKTSPGEVDREFDTVFTQNGPGWTGADSTYSIRLPNGDSVFFFSDSYIAESPSRAGDGTVSIDGSGIRRRQANCHPPYCDPPTALFYSKNSLVVREKTGRLRTLTGPPDANGFSSSFFKLPTGSDPTHYYWLGDSVVVPSNDRGEWKLWVFLMEFDPKLAYFGTAIAQLSIPTLKIESIQKLSGTEGSTVAWGSSVLLEKRSGTPVLYIYGIQNKQKINGKVPYLAKVDPQKGVSTVSVASNWTVWNGSDWVKGVTNATQVIGAPTDPNNAGDQISDEFSVKRLRTGAGDVYVLVGMDTTIPFGKWKHITLYSACRPEGPWSSKQVVYTTPEAESKRVPGMNETQSLAGPLVVYNPHLHPQFTNEKGLLISYNINTSKAEDLMFADSYRPHFFRVKIAGLKISQ